MTARNDRQKMADNSPLAKVGGCIGNMMFLWFEFTIGIVIAMMVSDRVSPGLEAHGYNTKIGTGFLIALGLGAIVAIYPVIWVHRFRRQYIL